MNEKNPTHIDDATFGNSPAALKLAQILRDKNDGRLLRKTCRIVSRFADQFALIRKIQISSFREEGQRKYLSQLVYSDAEATLKTMAIDEEIKSFILNVLTVHRNKYK